MLVEWSQQVVSVGPTPFRVLLATLRIEELKARLYPLLANHPARNWHHNHLPVLI
jgi:hypothetical protein